MRQAIRLRTNRHARWLFTVWLGVLSGVLWADSLHGAFAQELLCLPDGDVNLDTAITPTDARLAFQHFLGTTNPPLGLCQQQHANVHEPQENAITPLDVLCIFQRFLRLPSCLDAPPNLPPMANAGLDQAASPGSTVTLDGSASSDVNNDPLTFLWELTVIPSESAASLDDPTATNPVFAADDKDTDRDGVIDLACGGEDVNDDDPNVNPRVAEVCDDGLDNDSNTLIDSADPQCAAGCDQDDDQYPGIQCGGNDTNDFDGSTFPAAAEQCNDFVDNNQNGLVDEDCHPGVISLGPADLRVLAGDSVILRVVDGQQSTPTAWTFAVEGIDTLGANLSVAARFFRANS